MLHTRYYLKNMEHYIKFKHYDPLFGHTVPLILANGLRVNIVILISPMDAENDHKVCCEDQNVCDATIYVYKKGDHYVDLEPISSSNTGNYNSVLWGYQSSSFNCDVKVLVWNINGLNVHKLDKKLKRRVDYGAWYNSIVRYLDQCWAGFLSERLFLL